MQPAASQCNAQLLQQSLSDRLTELQEEQLAAHLTNCESCRQTLEQLAAGGDVWHRISSVLRLEAAQTASGKSQSLVIPRDVPATIHSHELLPVDFAVDFLQPSSDPDSIGQLDNIQFKAVIGHGGNGIVLKGHQPELNRLVAVKVMAPHLATSAAARQRFAREAQATAAIVHPSVMPILSVHSSGQLPFIVMPYVDCESLQQRLDRNGALPIVDILRIALQMARGLQAAHAQGLVHRDVKPANILLERGVDRAMLTDFGLARAVDDASLTRTGLIAGTPQYMSPEQARGDGIDPRSDLFSLGSVLYAMSTGRPPFRAETSYGILRRVTDETPRSITDINPVIPDWLEAIINRLLAKSAADRFASADELAELLEDCLAHVQQPHGIPLPAAARALVPENRTSPSKWLIIGIIAMLIAAPLTAVILSNRTPDSRKKMPDTANHASLNDNLQTTPPQNITQKQTSLPAEQTTDPAGSDNWMHDPALDIQQLNAEIDQLLQIVQ